MTSEKISVRGLKSFLRHIAIVSSKYKKREVARDKLGNHMKKLKASTLGNKTKKKIMAEFKDLENKMSTVLQMEGEILRMGKGHSSPNKKLADKVDENSRRMKDIYNDFSELKSKVEQIHDAKLKREMRIGILEKKIMRSKDKKAALPEVAAKLEFLEQKFVEMRDSGKYGKKELEKIKFKIDSLKLKAAVSKF